jgi:hypothetical protein
MIIPIIRRKGRRIRTKTKTRIRVLISVWEACRIDLLEEKNKKLILKELSKKSILTMITNQANQKRANNQTKNQRQTALTLIKSSNNCCQCRIKLQVVELIWI